MSKGSNEHTPEDQETQGSRRSVGPRRNVPRFARFYEISAAATDLSKTTCCLCGLSSQFSTTAEGLGDMIGPFCKLTSKTPLYHFHLNCAMLINSVCMSPTFDFPFAARHIADNCVSLFSNFRENWRNIPATSNPPVGYSSFPVRYPKELAMSLYGLSQIVSSKIVPCSLCSCSSSSSSSSSSLPLCQCICCPTTKSQSSDRYPATITCCEESCNNVFHLPCAMKAMMMVDDRNDDDTGNNSNKMFTSSSSSSSSHHHHLRGGLFLHIDYCISEDVPTDYDVEIQSQLGIKLPSLAHKNKKTKKRKSRHDDDDSSDDDDDDEDDSKYQVSALFKLARPITFFYCPSCSRKAISCLTPTTSSCSSAVSNNNSSQLRNPMQGAYFVNFSSLDQSCKTDIVSTLHISGIIERVGLCDKDRILDDDGSNEMSNSKLMKTKVKMSEVNMLKISVLDDFNGTGCKLRNKSYSIKKFIYPSKLVAIGRSNDLYADDMTVERGRLIRELKKNGGYSDDDLNRLFVPGYLPPVVVKTVWEMQKEENDKTLRKQSSGSGGMMMISPVRSDDHHSHNGSNGSSSSSSSMMRAMNQVPPPINHHQHNNNDDDDDGQTHQDMTLHQQPSSSSVPLPSPSCIVQYRQQDRLTGLKRLSGMDWFAFISVLNDSKISYDNDQLYIHDDDDDDDDDDPRRYVINQALNGIANGSTSVFLTSSPVLRSNLATIGHDANNHFLIKHSFVTMTNLPTPSIGGPAFGVLQSFRQQQHDGTRQRQQPLEINIIITRAPTLAGWDIVNRCKTSAIRPHHQTATDEDIKVDSVLLMIVPSFFEKGNPVEFRGFLDRAVSIMFQPPVTMNAAAAEEEEEEQVTTAVAIASTTTTASRSQPNPAGRTPSFARACAQQRHATT